MAGETKGRSRIWLLLAMILVTAIAICASCSKGSLSEQSRKGIDGKAPAITLSAITPTASSTTDTLDLTIVNSQGGFDVAVYASTGTPDLDELFFAVDYDATELQAHNLNVDAATNSDVLGLAVEPEPGLIEVGLVATATAKGSAVTTGDKLVSFRLLEETERTASEANNSCQSRARNLELSKNSGSNWVLSWDYTNPGDANQDGEVGIQDLTPIGLHYLEKVSNSWDDPLRHIDGDINGEINLADITPVGMNYRAEIWAYQIEMSEDGESEFVTVGQLLLSDEERDPNVTVRFSYEFSAQYVSDAWYRVVPLNRDLLFGIPSEAISEEGRRIDPISVPTGGKVTITVYAHDLPVPIAQMNSVRLVFPACYEYVENSANPGSVGGERSDVDGIWASFATELLFPPDAFIVATDIGDGMKAIDFNVTTILRSLPAAPVGYGDLFNFKLENTGYDDLTLEFEAISDDGLDRTYYTDENGENHYFGNNIGIST